MAGPFIPHIHAPELIKKPYVLIGPLYSGKKTVGRELAALCDCLWFDMDMMISRKLGVPVKDLSKTVSTTEFHILEARCFKEAFNFGRTEPKVITTTCSTFHSAELVEIISKDCNNIYLKHLKKESLIRNAPFDYPDIDDETLLMYHEMYAKVKHQLHIRYSDNPNKLAQAIKRLH